MGNGKSTVADCGKAGKMPTAIGSKTCTILTTTLNSVTSAVHDRMPVIVHSVDYDLWLDPGVKDSAVVSDLLKPLDATAMRCYAVSSRVNSMQTDDAECSMQVEVTEPQPTLF